MQTFKDVVSVDLAMASNLGSSNKRNINRGFAFVRFSSHAVSLCLTGGKVFFSLYILHLPLILICFMIFRFPFSYFVHFVLISLSFPFAKAL